MTFIINEDIEKIKDNPITGKIIGKVITRTAKEEREEKQALIKFLESKDKEIFTLEDFKEFYNGG